MELLSVNTEELINKGENIMNLYEEYDIIIDKLFTELQTLNEVAWKGDASKAYTDRVLFDKAQYKVFANNINIYGKVLKQTGDFYNNFIKKWNFK